MAAAADECAGENHSKEVSGALAWVAQDLGVAFC
jgi:hypothetical protein